MAQLIGWLSLLFILVAVFSDASPEIDKATRIFVRELGGMTLADRGR